MSELDKKVNEIYDQIAEFGDELSEWSDVQHCFLIMKNEDGIIEVMNHSNCEIGDLSLAIGSSIANNYDMPADERIVCLQSVADFFTDLADKVAHEDDEE